MVAFDNDGTLWVEQPIYVMIRFAADRMKALAPSHPEWNTNPKFKAVIDGGQDAILSLEPKDQFAVGFAVHAGMTTDEYRAGVVEWLATHRHPRFARPYTDLAYAPMLELIAYLRANSFQIYSSTGAELDFVRVVNEKSFGIGPTHVLATLLGTRFNEGAGRPSIDALPDLKFLNDGDGKPLGLHNTLGRRPIAAFGNSDGDLAMLEWTAGGGGVRLMALIHHDDAEREYAYDRTSPVGKLDKALDAANSRKWTVVSMKRDWKDVFASPTK